MIFHIRILFITAFFLLCSHCIVAQDIYRNRHNALKVGFFLTKAEISYECAFLKHVSVGLTATGNFGDRYPGYSGNIFARYYFLKFNESGWFLEAKATSGHYTPYVYDSYYIRDGSPIYTGGHTGHVDFIGGTVSGGYKKYCNNYLFFEFITGIRAGQSQLGQTDTYIQRSSAAQSLGGSDDTQVVFMSTGPGSYIDVMIHFGIVF